MTSRTTTFHSLSTLFLHRTKTLVNSYFSEAIVTEKRWWLRWDPIGRRKAPEWIEMTAWEGNTFKKQFIIRPDRTTVTFGPENIVAALLECESSVSFFFLSYCFQSLCDVTTKPNELPSWWGRRATSMLQHCRPHPISFSLMVWTMDTISLQWMWDARTSMRCYPKTSTWSYLRTYRRCAGAIWPLRPLWYSVSLALLYLWQLIVTHGRQTTVIGIIGQGKCCVHTIS